MMLQSKMVLLTVLLLAVDAFTLGAQEQDYSVKAIPENLRKDADAIVRNSHTELNIVSEEEVYITTRFAVTILNEKGERYSVATGAENKFHKVISMEGRLYDKDGQQIKKLKNRDIRMVSPFSEQIDDTKYKVFSFDCHTYPYTCEYEIETKLTSTLSLPPWMPQESYDCAVEYADLHVTYPKDFVLQYRMFHLDVKPSVTTTETNSWSVAVTDIHAGNKPDYFTPTEDYYYPTILFSSPKFSIGGTGGSMATWQDFGKYMYALNANRDQLPDAVKTQVHKLTDTCSSTQNRIAALYDYLKKNTRYVAIELGIGGWQTLDASFVAEKGYGDCKALSNYMKALLKEAGITGLLTLAYAGNEDRQKMQPDFPGNQFNHMILCVPGSNDTTWLECTSKILPPNYLSAFTGNRYVLLLTPDGGFPVQTPGTTIETNTLVQEADIILNDKDEINGRINIAYQGHFWETENRAVTGVAKTDVDKHLNSLLRLASYTVSDYKIKNDTTARIPVIRETLSVKGESIISRTGRNIFLSPAAFSVSIQSPPSYNKRTNAFELKNSFRVRDSVTFHLTGTHKLESKGKTDLNFPFASYHYNTSLEAGDMIKVVMEYEQKEGVYAADLFADYIKLYKQINTDAGNRIVLSRND